MSHQPKKWLGSLLGLVSPPMAMLYVARWKLACIYLGIAVLCAAIGIGFSEWRAVIAWSPWALGLVGAVHAYVLARKYPEEKPRPVYSRWYAITGAAAALVFLVVGVRAFVFEPFVVPSGSMLPSISVRAGVIAQKWGYGNYGAYGFNLLRAPVSSPLQRGDIAVFESPSNRSLRYVGRLVGLPGDKVVYRNKQLFINGDPASLRPTGDYFDRDSLTYLPRFVESLQGVEYGVLFRSDAGSPVIPRSAFPFSERCSYRQDEISCEVPAGHFFAMGDNRDNSYDSRSWGFLPADHLVGKVLFVGS